ncbi:MAG: 50S ribosomal protein L29 [Deltaproteobacteria bacterium]|jgi:large subunit ribosomal protein L29|nr:50S ribosomal protein L29 [Deltaproteobacteria bacterium]
MSAQELRKLSAEELRQKLTESRQELFNLRFRHATAQLENTSELPRAKRNIARILTLLGQKEA